MADMMTAHDRKQREAVDAIIALAESNFPRSTDLRVEAVGQNSGSITIPAYALREMLKPPENPNG